MLRAQMTPHPSEKPGETPAESESSESPSGARGGRRRMTASRATPRRSQAERRSASKSGLLRAALALIAERGFRGTSFQAIAQRAGYSPSLVSHRFGSKEGLFAEMVGRMVKRWGADVRLSAIEGRVGVEALGAIAHAHHRALTETPDAVRAMYVLLFESLLEAPALRQAFAALDARHRAGNAELLRAGIAAGSVRADLDPEAQATLFLAALRGIALQWLVDPTSIDLERAYGALDQLLARGLKP